jgi:ABC-type multidrug transport system fused ATPase/permease subunit
LVKRIAGDRMSLTKRLLKVISNTGISIVVVFALWMASLWIFQVTPYIGKNPIDVFNFLFSAPSAEENRELVFGALFHTLLDAAIGFTGLSIVQPLQRYRASHDADRNAAEKRASNRNGTDHHSDFWT